MDNAQVMVELEVREIKFRFFLIFFFNVNQMDLVSLVQEH